MNRKESKVVLRNIENKMKAVGPNDGQDQLTKKRRAAFTEVSNNENTEIGQKKTKCAKKQDTQPLAQKIQTTRQPLQPKQVKVAAFNKQQPAVAAIKAVNRTAVTAATQPAAKSANHSNNIVAGHATQTIQRVEVLPEIRNEVETETEKMAFDIDSSAVDATEKASSQPELISVGQTNIVESVVDAEMEDLCSRFEWIDVDKEHKDSPYYVTEYVNDIFEYYKEREAHFAVREDYMMTVQNAAMPGELSIQMRSILVDWLVEVQQNFELTHETLYLAVKMVDRYLSVELVRKDRLQLVGACALCIACKYEERCPPILDDYLYVCDDAYNAAEFLEMEAQLLKAFNFEIGCPLSYTYLRRYAQCARVSIPTLTLARYMTESALVDYQYVVESESRLAAAALLLAMTILSEGTWDATMIHYTGFVKSDLGDLVRRLNVTIGTPPSKTLSTVHTKYSHEVFHKVATLSPLTEQQLFELLSTSQ